MRKTTTLLLLTLLQSIIAQVPGDTLRMYFDDASDNLHLDSIYPAGCWQIGQPDKTTFTSAYSEPNALVTDTLLPHADSVTCYAEFTLITSDPGYGMHLDFRYTIDTDSLDSYGWVEQFDNGWVDAELSDWYDDFHPTWIGDRYAFTGRSSGWQLGHVYIGCIKFAPLPDTVRMRFAFHGGSNPSLLDGWIIDEVDCAIVQCDGGVPDPARLVIGTYPNPATGPVMLRSGMELNSDFVLAIYRPDGALVIREVDRYTGNQLIDVSSFSDGPYLVSITTPTQQGSTLVIVQH